MKSIALLFIPLVFLFSCSKQEECICNGGDGEYEYFSSTNANASSGYGSQYGNLEEECRLEEQRLKLNVSQDSYCELR